MNKYGKYDVSMLKLLDNVPDEIEPCEWLYEREEFSSERLAVVIKVNAQRLKSGEGLSIEIYKK